ncbi:MAG: hypothetical protein JO064_08015 [Actinobacteria bacterium]|nr:hypothetical protein [Actinomycetota bacterium]MBV8598010.1 hypothetical protein [Actinomycetota bacterium]
MDEATKVLRRLERIDGLDGEQAEPGRLLAELRELVREAEAWARCEGDARAGAAAVRLEESLRQEVVPISTR